MPRLLSLADLPTLRAARSAQQTSAYEAACAALGWGRIQQADAAALQRLALYVASRAPRRVTIHEPYGVSYEIEIGGPKG
jgi:hypothetical protein